MKHLVIDARILGTSTGRYVDELLRNFPDSIYKDFSVTILVTSKANATLNQADHPYRVVVCDYKMYSLYSQFALAWKLYRLKADLVHFAFQFTPLLYTRPYIVTIHDLTQVRFKNNKGNLAIYSIKQKFLSYVIKVSAKRAKHIITPTQFVKDDVVKTYGVSEKKVSVTYESGDVYKNASYSPVKSLIDKKFIFYVGTAHAHKNLPRLVSAFALIQKQQPDLHLVFAGKKDIFYEKLETYTSYSEVEHVHFLGFVSDEELNWLYKRSLAYIFPSMSEGFGLPGLEAMAHRVVVISSNATCLPEVYSEAAAYFDPYDTNNIASVILDVLNNKKLQQKLISAGTSQLKKYSWKKMSEQTLEIYKTNS